MTATTVSLSDLTSNSVPFPTLESAFGPSSLGILIVKDLPAKYSDLRRKLLSYSSYLAQLPSEELEALTNAAANYEIGWSHGKEALKDGQYDTMKGSYYVDCQSFYLDNPIIPSPGQPATRGSGTNLWPPEHIMPGFRETFQELCTLLIDIGALVARAIDLYAAKNIPDYQVGYLEDVVRTSHTPKARLLHYFPSQSTESSPPSSADSPTSSSASEDTWCATHLDDGCLTALTSALYLEETHPLPPLSPTTNPSLSSAILPSSPDPTAGLYIRSRTSAITQISIPSDCIAFQTGEALQLITGGKFRAVEHFVRGPKGEKSRNVARNTLAVFMQPDVDEVIDKERGLTYGEFVRLVGERFS